MQVYNISYWSKKLVDLNYIEETITYQYIIHILLLIFKCELVETKATLMLILQVRFLTILAFLLNIQQNCALDKCLNTFITPVRLSLRLCVWPFMKEGCDRVPVSRPAHYLLSLWRIPQCPLRHQDSSHGPSVLTGTHPCPHHHSIDIFTSLWWLPWHVVSGQKEDI